MMSNHPKDESELKDLELLISQAFKEIDKAVGKGILHENNGARKKARCSRYKRKVLIASGERI
jgi:small subunit ribosomal protein S20